jgi:hypothetical protein
MRARGAGRILITGSIAGFIPGTFSRGLQRHQGLHRLLLIRAARRVEGQWGYRDLSDARRH